MIDKKRERRVVFFGGSGSSWIFARFLASAALAFFATGCGGVKSMSPEMHAVIARADTVYVWPVEAVYKRKGLLFKRVDSLRTERLRARLDSLLIPEMARALPGTIVVRAEPDNPRAFEGVRFRLEAYAFRKTLPRQILSDVSDVVLMIPSFGRNMASPILPSSRLRLEMRWPGRRQVTVFKHEDEVQADDFSQLLFQVRMMLDSRYRG